MERLAIKLTATRMIAMKTTVMKTTAMKMTLMTSQHAAVEKYLPPKTQNGDQDHGWDNRDKNENEENDSNENDTYYIISHQTAS